MATGTSAPEPSPPPPPALLQHPAVSPTPLLTGADPAAIVARRRAVALMTNNVRLENVVKRIQEHFRIEPSSPPSDLGNLAFSLSRGIDYALSHNDIPAVASHLPSVIKQVYQFQNDASLQPALMVLLIAVKNACTNKWLPAADANELLSKTNELWSSFCMSKTSTVDDIAQDTISKIMPRFYPHLLFHRLICSLEAKAGYDILMADFHIPRNYPPDEKIHLLVVQTHNLETSLCITNPEHVNFLVNGKAVERRTNISMDTGPQFPTDITKILKYGTNIIQAIGYFNGPCIIAIAFMSKIASPCVARLEDYVYRVSEYLVLDSEVTEGPSTITLNCPISFTRIRIPVKGYHCKHYQCFDYDNFMEMNSWKPSWRCPCCNTPTNCTDLRIDQKIVKILEEVGDDVSDIIIFVDGSWKASKKKQQETIMGDGRGGTSPDVMDLTMDDNYTCDTDENPKVVPSRRTADTTENSVHQLGDGKPIMEGGGIHIPLCASEVLGVSTVRTQAVSLQAENDLWSGNLSWTSCSVSTAPVFASTTVVGTLESLVPSVLLNPAQTNVVSSVHNQGYAGTGLPEATVNFQQVSVAPSAVLNPIQNNAIYPGPGWGPTSSEHLPKTVNFQQVPSAPNLNPNPIQANAGSSALIPYPAVSEVPQSTVNFQQKPAVPSVMVNPAQNDASSPALNQGPAVPELTQSTLNFQKIPVVPTVILNSIQTSPTVNQGPEVPRSAMNFQQKPVLPSVVQNPTQTNYFSPELNQVPAVSELPQSNLNFQQKTVVPSIMLNPTQTDAFSPAFNQGPSVSELPHSTLNFQQIPSVPSVILNRTQTEAFPPGFNQSPAGSVFPQTKVDYQLVPHVAHQAENMQLQPLHARASTTTDEAQRQHIPRHVTRIPITVQALPAQTLMPRSSQRMQTATAGVHGSANDQVQTTGLSKSSNVSPAAIQQHSIAQKHQHHRSASLQPVASPSTPNPIGTGELRGQPRGVGAYRATSPPPQYYWHPHHLSSQTIHHSASPSNAPEFSHTPSSQIRQASHNPAYAAAAAMGSNLHEQHWQTGGARVHSSVRIAPICTFNDSGATMLSSRSGTPANQDWQPSGRMRGSLIGNAYQAAMTRYTNPTSTQSQAQPFPANASSQFPVSASSTPHSQEPMIQQDNIIFASSGNQAASSHGFFDAGYRTTYY